MPTHQEPFETSDLSSLPNANPGSGRPWRDPTTGALIVGALGAFGLSQAAADTLYAALSHTHSIAQVSGLQGALDGKQPVGSYASASHTHAIADVTGLQGALDGKQTALGYTPVNKAGDTMTGALSAPGFIGGYFVGGLTAINYGGAGLKLASTADIEFAPSSVDTATDAIIIRNATGQIDVRGDSGLRIRNLANSAGAALTAASATIPTINGNTTFSNNVTVQGLLTGPTTYLTGLWLNNSNAGLGAPNSGVILLQDGSGANFNRLTFGGTSSAYPSIKRVGASLAVRLADDSADAPLTASRVGIGTSTTANAQLEINVGATNNILFGRNATYSTVPAISMNGTLSDTAMAGFFADINAGVGQNFYINAPQRIIFRPGGNGVNSNFVLGSNQSLGVGYGNWNADPSGTSGALVVAGRVGIGTANPSMALQVVGSVSVSGLTFLGVYTVATLPSASANSGAFAQVTDANSTTNGTTAAGGGSNRVPVFSNGTNWIIK